MNFAITYLIIGITAVVSIMAFQQHDIYYRFIFNPYDIDRRKQWYRFISNGFIHADYQHLFVNMLTLFFFGRAVEATFTDSFVFDGAGIPLYIFMYLSAIAISSYPAYRKYRHSPGYNSLGASGAVSAVLFASILFNPMGGIGMLFIPIKIPGILFGGLYLWYSSYMSKRNMDNIGHDAHFWGAVYGFFFPLVLKPKLGELFLRQIAAVFGISW